MPYKISGTVSDTTKVMIFKESDWSLEESTTISGYSTFEILDVASGTKTIIGRRISDGMSIGYGNITPLEYSGGARAVFGGGETDNSGTDTDIMDYVSISSTGNATDFGDLVIDRRGSFSCSNGSNDRGIFSGDNQGLTNSIDYITVSAEGDASDFGDLTLGGAYAAGCSDGTNERGVFGARYYVTRRNTIDYITINSIGNALDFGDLSRSTDSLAGLSNATGGRGIFAGGWVSSFTGIVNIDYITIGTTGNSTDFGDLNNANHMCSGNSNGTNNRGLIAGGYVNGTTYIDVIDYITINSAGNATDFGDLTDATVYCGAASNGTDERGVFGGGAILNPSVEVTDKIDYVTINSAGNASDFGDITTGRQRLSALSNA